MKNTIIFCFLLTLTISTYGQNDSILKYTFNKENVVASAIDGTWKSVNSKRKVTFKKDTTALKLVPKKYYKFLKNKTIYHAGFVLFSDQDKNLPFILIENDGNPYILYFRERNNDPYGDGESFNLFIAKGYSKNEDKLYIGGDFNNQSFREFSRTE